MESLENKINKYEPRFRELNTMISTQNKSIKDISLQLINKALKDDFENLLDHTIDLENQADKAKKDSLQHESYS